MKKQLFCASGALAFLILFGLPAMACTQNMGTVYGIAYKYGGTCYYCDDISQCQTFTPSQKAPSWMFFMVNTGDTSGRYCDGSTWVQVNWTGYVPHPSNSTTECKSIPSFDNSTSTSCMPLVADTSAAGQCRCIYNYYGTALNCSRCPCNGTSTAGSTAVSSCTANCTSPQTCVPSPIAANSVCTSPCTCSCADAKTTAGSTACSSASCDYQTVSNGGTINVSGCTDSAGTYKKACSCSC